MSGSNMAGGATSAREGRQRRTGVVLVTPNALPCASITTASLGASLEPGPRTWRAGERGRRRNDYTFAFTAATTALVLAAVLLLLFQEAALKLPECSAQASSGQLNAGYPSAQAAASDFASTTDQKPLPLQDLAPILQQEVRERIEKLGQVSDTKGSLQRTFLSPAALRAARLIDSWMQEAGMRTWTDGFGNVHGRVDGPNYTAPVLLMGSHMDTVADAGKYDGLLGVLCAIAAVKAFVRSGRVHTLQRPVEVIAFSDEEGVRFQSTFLGSNAVAGKSPPDILYSTDSNGITMASALDGLGLEGATKEGMAAMKYDPARVWGYVELHIEQGPVLEDEQAPLGVVPAIAGQTRLRVLVQGEQGHAGTVPMRMRKDPMAAAAAAIAAIERICLAPAIDPDTGLCGEGEADVSGLVCTVGQVDVWPGASNVIPGQVVFTADIRARKDSVRKETVESIKSEITSVCTQRKLQCRLEVKHEAAAVECSPAVADLLAQAAVAATKQLGMSPPSKPDDAIVPKIVSGAGHDAMAMAQLTQVGMLFVRCRGGISHRPDEHVSDEDIMAASSALLLLLQSPPISR